MAKNRVYGGEVDTLRVTLANATSGAPVVVGQIPGVALTDTDADGKAVIAFRGVYRLAVWGVDGVGNSAVAVGDKLYYTAADATKLSKKNTGVFFGYALGAVAAGATATIEVLLALS